LRGIHELSGPLFFAIDVQRGQERICRIIHEISKNEFLVGHDAAPPQIGV
jgi:hypothetical protein